MVSVHRVHTHERDDVCSRAEMSSESITQLTDRTSSLEEQYQFFQEMRGYVRDLVECLNEKVGLQYSLPVCCVVSLSVCLSLSLSVALSVCFILVAQIILVS